MTTGVLIGLALNLGFSGFFGGAFIYLIFIRRRPDTSTKS